MPHIHHITSHASTNAAGKLTSLMQKIIMDDIQGFDPVSV
jgi:hypothetical protein